MLVPMTIEKMIKKELAGYNRVPGSSDQKTDLDITLHTCLSWSYQLDIRPTWRLYGSPNSGLLNSKMPNSELIY